MLRAGGRAGGCAGQAGGGLLVGFKRVSDPLLDLFVPSAASRDMQDPGDVFHPVLFLPVSFISRTLKTI